MSKTQNLQTNWLVLGYHDQFLSINNCYISTNRVTCGFMYGLKACMHIDGDKVTEQYQVLNFYIL